MKQIGGDVGSDDGDGDSDIEIVSEESCSPCLSSKSPASKKALVPLSFLASPKDAKTLQSKLFSSPSAPAILRILIYS